MKKNLEKRLKSLNVVVSSHVFATGPALDLEKYLKDKVKSLLFIGHPFSSIKGEPSFYRSYEKSRLKKEHKSIKREAPGVFLYIREAIYTFFWVAVRRDKVNLYIGSDSFLAYLGLLLKRFGKVEKVIFYTIDYVPERFTNPILNRLYHFFDTQCVKNADIVWNVSQRIAEARKDHKGLEGENLAEQIVVPIGIWLERTKKNQRIKKDKDRLVFLGHLRKNQGLQVVIDAMVEVSKKLPKARLFVIGTGPYEKILKIRVKRKGLQKKVVFLGYIKSHERVEKELAKSSIAVAAYVPTPESFTYFADPGKIKSYLAAGLPVVLTDVPQIAKSLAKEKCGLITDYDASSVAKKLDELLGNNARLNKYSNNALKYASRFGWNKIFSKALEVSLK